MGYSQQWLRQAQPQEKLAAVLEAAKARHAADQVVVAKRMALADKIVMAVVDHIAAEIIRPGPKPEERECYVMAQELRDYAPHLAELVAAILAEGESHG